MQAASAHPSTLGRFKLVRLHGRGAQASVWQAYDPLLERNVALKLLHPDPNSRPGPDQKGWLNEARSLSRLAHPHIVTLYEADIYDGQAGLVLEYIQGLSLAQEIKKHGALRPEHAVSMMLQILGALTSAHEQEVVHRDLKPANILLDHQGNAKVSDFGLATRVKPERNLKAPLEVHGSPGYLSPEAARGEQASPTSDVFSAGLVLFEMLVGVQAITENNPYRAIYRAAYEDLGNCLHGHAAIDDDLRAVLLRALARERDLRFQSAAEFAEALQKWQGQKATGDEATAQNNATLDFLIRKIRRNGDFPAMSEQIIRVQSLASSERGNLSALANEILKDVALTNKVLRIVNSAHFSHVGAGHINTVSRAISLIGLTGVRNAAASLVLMDHMSNKAHAAQLKHEFVRALLAAALATELQPPQKAGEEVFIGALFQNLGRMLTEFYLPDEAQHIRRLTGGRPAVNEEDASKRVLGISYEDLGQGVGKHWGLPERLLSFMRKPSALPPTRQPTDVDEKIRWASAAANELAECCLNSSADSREAKLQPVAARYSAVLGRKSEAVVSLTLKGLTNLAASVKSMGLKIPSTDIGGPHSKESGGKLSSGKNPQQEAPQPEASPADSQPEVKNSFSIEISEVASAILLKGIQDVSSAMMDDNVQINDVLKMIIETMYRALDFRQIILCTKDNKTGMLQGRIGFGEKVSETVKIFKVDAQAGKDLFAQISQKGQDAFIQDAMDQKLHKSLPSWHREHVKATAFVLFPMLNKGLSFGLIYADYGDRTGSPLGTKGLSMLKTLRNQAVMAIRQVQQKA